MTPFDVGDATRRLPFWRAAMEEPADGAKHGVELPTDEISIRNLLLTCENRPQILSGTDRYAPGSHDGSAALTG